MQNYNVSPQEAAQELLARRQARKGLTEFVAYTTPRWEPSRIHREIGEAFDAVMRGEIDRVLLQCPPQHGKSTMASKRFPAYVLGRTPHTDIISASATASLAEEFGGEVRNCIRSNEYRALFPDITLREDSQAKGRWATNEGGSYYAIGVGGQLFGKGAELGLIDDPFGSWEDAQSELNRKKVYDWYTGTFYNRIRPDGRIIVIQHRMHEDDLVGLLIEAEKHGGDRWKIIKLPADISDPPWPERYDSEALERIKSNVILFGGMRKWNALYLQDPTPEEGSYFKRDWFRRYIEAPTNLNCYVTGDFAVSADEGDYTELAVWGVDSTDKVYALDWWAGRKTADIWIDRLLDLVESYKALRFVGEMGPIRRAIEPLLERRMRERGVFVACEWLPTNADKAAQARSFQGLASLGRIYWPQVEWAERVIDQCLRFPGGRFDDAVDACSIFGRFIASTWAARSEPAPVATDWDAPLRISDFFKKAS